MNEGRKEVMKGGEEGWRESCEGRKDLREGGRKEGRTEGRKLRRKDGS